MTSALKVADESNLPGFLAVTIITSIIMIIFLLLFFKLNPLSDDRLAVDGQLFPRLQIARRYECECDWFGLVFSVTLDLLTSAPSASFSPKASLP